MDPATAQALIGAGAQGGNMISSMLTNRWNRQFAEKMYAKQRADALADRDWQAAYQDPSAQMARYKAAGLNPNLIYGQQQSAPTIRSVQAPNFQAQAPQIDAGLLQYTLGASQRIRGQEAQIDNTLAQRALIEAQTLKTLKEGNIKGVQYDLAMDNYDATVSLTKARSQAAEMGLNQIGLEALYTQLKIDALAQNIDITAEQRAAKLDSLLASNENTRALTSIALSKEDRAKMESSVNIARTMSEIAMNKVKALQIQVQTENDVVKRSLLNEQISQLKLVQEKTAGEIGQQTLTQLLTKANIDWQTMKNDWYVQELMWKYGLSTIALGAKFAPKTETRNLTVNRNETVNQNINKNENLNQNLNKKVRIIK